MNPLPKWNLVIILLLRVKCHNHQSVWTILRNFYVIRMNCSSLADDKKITIASLIGGCIVVGWKDQQVLDTDSTLLFVILLLCATHMDVLIETFIQCAELRHFYVIRMNNLSLKQ